MVDVLSTSLNYKSSLNIDRIKHFTHPSHANSMHFITAAYHLNPQTQTKTGALTPYNITASTITPLSSLEFNVDYGILDIKRNSSNELIYSSNSNNTYSIFDFETHSVSNIKLPCKDSNDAVTCNTIELCPSTAKVFLTSNNGYHHIYDMNTNEHITSIKSHEYGIWSLFVFDTNVYVTGSEDNCIKVWDLRVDSSNAKCVGVNNKSFNSSVNVINRLNALHNDNVLFIGSYDEKVVFVDARCISDDIKQIRTGHSLWDYREVSNPNNVNENLIFMACIYEGINVYSIDKVKGELDLKHEVSLPLNGNYHNSIVYGIDTLSSTNNNDKSINVLSCSFYDNTILNWNYV